MSRLYLVCALKLSDFVTNSNADIYIYLRVFKHDGLAEPKKINSSPLLSSRRCCIYSLISVVSCFGKYLSVKYAGVAAHMTQLTWSRFADLFIFTSCSQE